MGNLYRIIKAIDFIENNLKSKIKVDDVASVACFSNFYFHKLFRLFVGDSPGQYIRKRRLYEAAIELKDTECKIIDVALEYHYESPEAFSRAFTKHFNINPKDIKKSKIEVIRNAKPKLTLSNLQHIQENIDMEPRIKEKGPIKLVGPVYYGDNKSNEIPKFWDKYFGDVCSLPTKKGNGCYGYCYHNSDYVEKGFFIICHLLRWKILILSQ